tara:strand:+ start:234 stop:1229 length:996 start_codon:yes stop_codon:yes gene_type:complete
MSLEDFNNIYSELINDLRTTYSLNISLNENASDKRYISHFIRNIIPYMDDISCMNLDALRYKHKNIFIVNGIKLTKILKTPKFMLDSKVLWKYFHTLYVICYKIPETQMLLKNYEDIENYNMISRNLEEYYYNTFLTNFDIILTEKEVSDSDTEEETAKSSNPSTQSTQSTQSSSSGKNKSDAELPGFLQNSLIGNLAKEISAEIDTTQLENLENPADLFSTLLGGGISGGLGDLIGSVVGKLTQKMQSGELDQASLMAEAAGLMGNFNLFGNDATAPAETTVPMETATPAETTVPMETATASVEPSQQRRTKSKKKKKRKKKKVVVSEES